MVSGDTAADKSVSGYVTNEAVTLSTTPTGSTYSWGISLPTGATARANISDSTAATPSFTPDRAGYYVVTCVVDSTTTYVIRISVTQVAITTSYEAIRFSPKAAASVPTPSVGEAAFVNSSDSNLLTRKNSSGALQALENRALTPTDTADATGNAGDIAYDSSFVYVKTAGGWKRAALVSF